MTDNRIRVKLSPYVQELMERAAKDRNRSVHDVFETFLHEVERLLRHEKVPGLPISWLDIVVEMNIERATPSRADDIAKLKGEHVAFDVGLLETSKRSKTGFAGVYATSGSTFRALVPDVEKGTGSRYLMSRSTPLQAAIDRYEWYERHGLPYGNLGAFVEDYRTRHPQATLKEAFTAALDFGDVAIKQPFTRTQVELALARLSGGEAPVEEPQKPASVESHACPVCDDPMTDYEPKSFIGDTLTLAHARCLDHKGRPLVIGGRVTS